LGVIGAVGAERAVWARGGKRTRCVGMPNEGVAARESPANGGVNAW